MVKTYTLRKDIKCLPDSIHSPAIAMIAIETVTGSSTLKRTTFHVGNGFGTVITGGGCVSASVCLVILASSACKPMYRY